MDKPIQAPAGGDQDKSGGILATSILALSSTMIFIILRFITRIFLVKKLWWDDYCIIFAGVRPFSSSKVFRKLIFGTSLVTALAWDSSCLGFHMALDGPHTT